MNKDKKIWGYGRNVFFAGLVSLFMDMSSEMAYPLIALFLADVLLVTMTTVGIIEGIAESTASLLKVFSGYISDLTKKRKPLMAMGYSVSTASRLLLYYAMSSATVMVARFTDRVGKGLRSAPRDALIADSVPKEELGRSFGFHRAMDTVGAIIGPGIALIVLAMTNDDIRSVFLASFVPGLIAVAIIFIFIKEKKEDKPHDTHKHQKLKITLRGMSKEFKTYIVTVGLFSLATISDAFLILRSSELGLTLVQIPLIYLIYNTVYALTSIPFGHLGDKIGLRPLISGGFLTYSLVLIGFAFAQTALHVWILFIFYGLYKGISDGAQRAYVGKLCDEHNKGTAFGVFHTVTGLMLLPASIGAGFIWDKWGVFYTFTLASAVAFSALVLFILTSREKQ